MYWRQTVIRTRVTTFVVWENVTWRTAIMPTGVWPKTKSISFGVQIVCCLQCVMRKPHTAPTRYLIIIIIIWGPRVRENIKPERTREWYINEKIRNIYTFVYTNSFVIRLIYIYIIFNQKGSVSNVHHLRWRTHCATLGFAWGTLIFWKQCRTAAAAPRQRWCVQAAEIITEIRYVECETGERNISPNKKRIEIIERFYTLYLYVCVCVYVWVWF